MRRIDQNRSKSMSNQATSVVFHVFPFQSRPGQKPHRCTSHGRMNKVMQNEKDKIWWNKNRRYRTRYRTCFSNMKIYEHIWTCDKIWEISIDIYSEDVSLARLCPVLGLVLSWRGPAPGWHPGCFSSSFWSQFFHSPRRRQNRWDWLLDILLDWCDMVWL